MMLTQSDKRFTSQESDRIIEMAWEDRTPFYAIEIQFGLSENELTTWMRAQLKPSSFRMWRKRVKGRMTKTGVEKTDTGFRFKSKMQKAITGNKISKRMIFVLIPFFSSLVCLSQEFKTIDSIVTSKVKNNYFEGTVVIADHGKIVYEKTAGLADHGRKLPIARDTKFGIASITKMLTAIVVLELVQENKLSLDETVARVLPQFAIPNADSITVHHLLLHITGLPNEDSSVYESKNSPSEYVKQTLLQTQPAGGFNHFNYANIDYVLLGLMIEKVTGHTWQEEISARIILKLNLQNTGFLEWGAYPKNLAHTYSISETGRFMEDRPIHIENFYAAGSMYSTVRDLLLIDQAMYGNTLLSDSSKKKMYRSYPQYNYTGYSVWTYHYPFAPGHPLIMERRGGILGSNSVIVRMLDLNKTLIILSNNDRFNPDSFGDRDNLREAIIIELGK